jgi:hypothetical protein
MESEGSLPCSQEPLLVLYVMLCVKIYREELDVNNLILFKLFGMLKLQSFSTSAVSFSVHFFPFIG